MSTFAKWLDTFISEANLDFDVYFEVGTENGVNIIPYSVVIDAIKHTSREEQKNIQQTIVKIDSMNGDIKHYFRHLGKALAI